MALQATNRLAPAVDLCNFTPFLLGNIYYGKLLFVCDEVETETKIKLKPELSIIEFQLGLTNI